MKLYTLEDYKAGRKAITRDGKEVSEIYYFETVERHKLKAVVDGDLKSYNNKGRYLGDSLIEEIDHMHDLFVKPEIETWYAVSCRWRNSDQLHIDTSTVFKTLEEALEFKKSENIYRHMPEREPFQIHKIEREI